MAELVDDVFPSIYKEDEESKVDNNGSAENTNNGSPARIHMTVINN